MTDPATTEAVLSAVAQRPLTNVLSIAKLLGMEHADVEAAVVALIGTGDIERTRCGLRVLA